MQSGKTITCVLLTLNEEGAIAKVVGDIRSVLPQAEIVVVDSSTDRTATIAEETGCTVVRQVPPRGYGWAMDAGFKKASGDYILTLDCDDTYPAEALADLVKRMDEGADVVSCSRMERRPPAMKFTHFIANRIFAHTARIVCGVKTTDVHTGMRAYRKSMLEKLSVDPEGMALPVELQIAPQRLGYNCQEFFIDYRPRIGESKIVALPGTIWTFRRIWRWRKFFNPRQAHSKLHMLAAVFMISSLLCLAPEAIAQPHWQARSTTLVKQAAASKPAGLQPTRSQPAASKPVTSKPAKMVSCMRFLQKTPILGEIEIKVTPTATRVELKAGGWVQFSCAPKWQSILLNEGAKTYFDDDKQDWFARVSKMGDQATSREAKQTVYPKREKVLWMETTKVKVMNVPPAPNVDCYYYKNPAIPVQLCRRLAIQSAAPHGGGLLVRMKLLDKEGPAAIKVDTLKADNLTVPASQFEIPKDFKRASSAQEIMLGTGADMLKDFIP